MFGIRISNWNSYMYCKDGTPTHSELTVDRSWNTPIYWHWIQLADFFSDRSQTPSENTGHQVRILLCNWSSSINIFK